MHSQKQLFQKSVALTKIVDFMYDKQAYCMVVLRNYLYFETTESIEPRDTTQILETTKNVIIRSIVKKLIKAYDNKVKFGFERSRSCEKTCYYLSTFNGASPIQ